MYVADRRELGMSARWQEIHARHEFDSDSWREQFSEVSIEEIRCLPTLPGVYVALTYDDIPVYVGSSYTSLRSRFMRHHRRRDFELLGVDRVAYFVCVEPDDHGLYSVELRLIRQLLPILNDRMRGEVGIEFFNGQRRMIPLSAEPGVGWKTRWKVKPSVGRPRRPAPPPAG